jgi:phosphorylcholine metabolism protein LicD
LHLWEPENQAPYFYDYVIHIYDDRYQWREKPEFLDPNYSLYNFVNVDFFILSSVPSSKIRRDMLSFRLKNLYGLSLAHRSFLFSDKVKYDFFEKCILRFFCLFGKMFSLKKIMAKRERIICHIERSSSHYCWKINDLIPSLSKTYEKGWFSNAVYLPFRDRSFPVPTGFDKQLTLMYGNYMKPDRDPSKYIQHLVEK